jgi:hypothetical protein
LTGHAYIEVVTADLPDSDSAVRVPRSGSQEMHTFLRRGMARGNSMNCADCSKSFTTKGGLKWHRDHRSETPRICSFTGLKKATKKAKKKASKVVLKKDDHAGLSCEESHGEIGHKRAVISGKFRTKGSSEGQLLEVVSLGSGSKTTATVVCPDCNHHFVAKSSGRALTKGNLRKAQKNHTCQDSSEEVPHVEPSSEEAPVKVVEVATDSLTEAVKMNAKAIGDLTNLIGEEFTTVNRRMELIEDKLEALFSGELTTTEAVVS